MDSSSGINATRMKTNQNIQVYVRVRPTNSRERAIRSHEVVEVPSSKEVLIKQMHDSKMSKKFTFDKAFGPDSRQSEVYHAVVAPLIEEVLAGYNCTVFAYGQTGTGKTHTMIGTECPELKSSWEDESMVGIIPRALSHLFDELRMMEVEFSMRISYLELYNEELCDLLSSDDTLKIRIYDDAQKKGSVIIQGLEEIPVHSKDDVYKLLEKGKERRKTATTLMNAQSSRSHTVFSILVHIKENGMDGEEMLKIGKLNLVDLAGSENISKAGNEKGIRTRETVNINQSLLTLGRVITALVERTPHIPYRESKLTRLLQESLGGRTKTSIIATVSPGHKDLEETMSTLDYAYRAKNIQNKPELNQKLTKKTVLKEYTEEIDRLKRDLIAARDKNGIYLPEETFNDMHNKLDSLNKELNEKMQVVKALKDDLASKEKIFNEVSLHLIEKSKELKKTEKHLIETKTDLEQTTKVLTTTKRRYQEKNHLLDTHVKTEKELTNQATQLIEVADLAISDTYKLHNTIEQRKTVDLEIKSACGVFVSKMENTFNDMNNKLENLQKTHTSYSQTIVEDIGVNSTALKKFSSCAIKKIKSISEKYAESVNDVNECLELFTSQFSHENSEHKTAILNVVDELKRKQNTLKLTFEQYFCEMLQLRDEQSQIVAKNASCIAMNVTETNQSVTEFAQIASSRFNEFKKNAKTWLEDEIAALCNEIDAGEKISLNHQTALESLLKEVRSYEQQMKSFKQQQDVSRENVKTAVNNLGQVSNRVCDNADYELQALQELTGKSQASFEKSEISLMKLKDETQNSVDKEIKLTAKVQEDVVPNFTSIESITGNLEEITENHSTKFTELFDSFKTETTTKQNDFKTLLDTECTQVTGIVAKETDRALKNQTQSGALNKSLQSCVKEYSKQYNIKITDCKEQLHKFESSELKTYTPSGQTPSRKDFSYPRILVSTSPHNNIIRRFRMDKDWSDTDTTPIIIEDSENSLLDLSIDELGINSTPIRNDTDDNPTATLKEIQAGFSNSETQVLSNSKEQTLSIKNTSNLRYNQENKENCAL